MNFFQISYFLSIKTLLESYGLWRSQSKISRIIMFFAQHLSVLSLMFALIAGLAEKHKKVPHVIYENTVVIVFLAVATAQFIILHSNKRKIKQVYEEFLLDYGRITNNKEKQIFMSYIRKGRHRVNFICFLCVPAYILAGGLTFYPAVKDNNKNARDEYFPYYYSKMIIDDRFYYSLADLHITTGIIFTSLCIFATGAVFIMYSTHVCGMFAIARYRLENVTNISNTNTVSNDLKSYQLIRNGRIICNMVNVIKKHTEAIQKVGLINDAFKLIILVIQVAALGGFGFTVYDIFRNDSTICHAVRSSLILLTFIVFNYLINWAAQEIIEISQQFFITSYSIDWYTLPMEAKQMLVILRHETNDFKRLTAGTIFILSLNNFLWILKTSWSVAAVLLSTQSRSKYTII